MRLKKTFPVFDFCIYHYDLFFMLVNVPGMPPVTRTHNEEKYWIHVCLFPCKKDVRLVSLHLHVIAYLR